MDNKFYVYKAKLINDIKGASIPTSPKGKIVFVWSDHELTLGDQEPRGRGNVSNYLLCVGITGTLSCYREEVDIIKHIDTVKEKDIGRIRQKIPQKYLDQYDKETR